MRHLREGVEQKFTKIIHFFCSLLPETSTYSITSQPHEQLISDHNHRGRSKQQVGGKKVYMRAEQAALQFLQLVSVSFPPVAHLLLEIPSLISIFSLPFVDLFYWQRLLSIFAAFSQLPVHLQHNQGSRNAWGCSETFQNANSKLNWFPPYSPN